ncbi:MAG: hypothetical protein GY749_14520 [Desulfobacteraceae bacterium]|nr:hypothetical protein [Desulfobacteraceae bacterium]
MFVASVLKDYADKIIPKLIENNYHIDENKMAKGGLGYEYLPEQSMFSHIVNAVFGFGRLMAYLLGNNLFSISEEEFRQVIGEYTVHDMHKLAKEKLGNSEFSVPMELIEEEISKLRLADFANINIHEVRAANTHARSSHHGDRLFAGSGATKRWNMIRIADSMGSIAKPGNISGLESYIKRMSSTLGRASDMVSWK